VSPDLKRELERKVKMRAVAFRRCLDMGSKRPDRRRPSAAVLLGLDEACLNNWCLRWKSGQRHAVARGRPATQAPDDTLAKVHDIFEDQGPGLSVDTLTGLCPELGRNEAERLLAEMRWKCREDHHATVTALQWMRPGTVWAMDHTRPPGAVDGLYPYVLLVRDLAGHFQVGAMPQIAATGRAVADALVDLFERHGAPLVLKFDNHGAFTGREVREVLEQYDVLPLVSPWYLPQYNGSVEAGAGHFKTRTHFLAARMNHPEQWTANIVEGARVMANRILRPWGKDGPTPDEQWKARRKITHGERQMLRHGYETRLAEYGRNPSLLPANEGGTFFRISRQPTVDGHRIGGNGETATETLAPWARRWNATPGHRRPTQTPALPLRVAAKRGIRGRSYAANPGLPAGQSRGSVVHCQRMRRRSLTDALVESGLLIIRKRRIPLPIKRLMRLKIS